MIPPWVKIFGIFLKHVKNVDAIILDMEISVVYKDQFYQKNIEDNKKICFKNIEK